MTGDRPGLEAVRARIDAVDAELLRLLDERAALAADVLAAKRAEAGGPEPGFGFRPAREAALIRRLLRLERRAAPDGLVVRVWRELISASLSLQGPFRLAVCGGRSPGRLTELARVRFGGSPPLEAMSRPEDALAAARTPGTVAVLPLEPGLGWWARLLAEPDLQVLATLPCLSAWGPPAALAVARARAEPSGADATFWVTDAPGGAAALLERLSALGLAGEVACEAGPLRLVTLAGYVEAADARLEAAPGRLKGVVGSAPLPFDL